MKTDILSGPACPARPHVDPFALRQSHGGGLLSRAIRAPFFDKENEGKDAPMEMGEFQRIALKHLEDAKKSTGDNITAHKELKKLCEDTFKEIETKTLGLADMAAKLATLERSSLTAERKGLTGKALLRTHEEACKEFGEGVKKATGLFVARAEGEDTSATGGNLVNPVLATDIYKLTLEYGQYKMLDVRAMSTKSEKMLVEVAEPDAVFVAENGNIPEQGLDLEQVNMTARKIAAIIGISVELIQDSAINIGAYILDKFARANARRTDYVAFMANGQSDVNGYNGGYTGLFNFGTVVAAAAGHTKVELMDFLDFLLCLTTVDPAVLANPNACWMMHPTMVARALAVVDESGRPIFLNALVAPANGGIGSILGYPVRMISVAPTDNSAGKPVAAFGDPEAYCVGNRMEYEFDFSDHARFTSAQRVYRGMSRKGFIGRRSTAIAILKTAAA